MRACYFSKYGRNCNLICLGIIVYYFSYRYYFFGLILFVLALLDQTFRTRVSSKCKQVCISIPTYSILSSQLRNSHLFVSCHSTRSGVVSGNYLSQRPEVGCSPFPVYFLLTSRSCPQFVKLLLVYFKADKQNALRSLCKIQSLYLFLSDIH